jgi:LysR family transcriptional activator of mexEF-oprN operon
MPSAYGRDLDLNLLRVFAMVAEAGSVTAAASRRFLREKIAAIARAESASLLRRATVTGNVRHRLT